MHSITATSFYKKYEYITATIVFNALHCTAMELTSQPLDTISKFVCRRVCNGAKSNVISSCGRRRLSSGEYNFFKFKSLVKRWKWLFAKHKLAKSVMDKRVTEKQS